MSEDQLPSAFEMCVTRSLRFNGTLDIDCKLGLWGVSSRNHEQAEREARRYWIQYYQDGEYKDLLK